MEDAAGRAERRVRKHMKLFGVDISAKWIFFEIEGRKYSVCFRCSLRKGIHDVSIHEDGTDKKAKVTGTYPPLNQWLPEMWRIWIPQWFKWKIKKFLQSHSR